MSNLNSPAIHTGPLTAADLDRDTNTGRVYHLHRATLLPAGCDNQGRHRTREFGRAPWHDTVPTDWDTACAIEGGQHADPVPAGRHTPSLIYRGWLWLLRTMG